MNPVFQMDVILRVLSVCSRRQESNMKNFIIQYIYARLFGHVVIFSRTSQILNFVAKTQISYYIIIIGDISLRKGTFFLDTQYVKIQISSKASHPIWFIILLAEVPSLRLYRRALLSVGLYLQALSLLVYQSSRSSHKL